MRLIDADELEHMLRTDFDTLYETIFDTIRRVPTIDAVPVVRCRDCKWYGTYQLTKYGEYDKRYKPTVCIKGEYSIMRNEDWYCADGERRPTDE